MNTWSVNTLPLLFNLSSLQISRGSLHADSISFAYPSRPHKKTLNGVSFAVGEGSFFIIITDNKIITGRSLALVGPSGGGKSTVVNLIERFYNPTQGQLVRWLIISN